MSDLNPYNPINSVDTTTYDWNCRVRLQSFWKVVGREKQEFWGINMVLIDDSNARIHAFANSKYCDNLLKEIKEGEVYVMSNFKVKDYLGDEKYRAVRNKKHIFFTPHTQFKKCEKVGLQIEKYAFDLFHYDEIEKLADDNRFLIDMVGKVKNVQELIKITKDEEEKTLFKFQISNGSSTVPVTFFDQFGQNVEKQFANYDSNNLYVIISFAKVGRYEGMPHLSNYPATRVFVNPKHYSVQELKRSWTEKKKEPVVHTIHKEECAVEIPRKIITVKDIKNLEANYGEDSVLCEVTVKRFTDQKNWYFRKCTGCDLELENEDGKFKCSRANGCGRIIPYPDKRFRLCTLCSDDSGSVAIVFPDHEITRIIDKTVIDLHAECADEAEEEKFPEILNKFIKQKYTINLSIHQDNLKKGSTVYHANEILHAQEKADSFDPNSATVVDVGDFSLESGTDANAKQTPNTGNSTNMKTRPRNTIEPVAFGPTESSIPPPEKKIKVEKYSTIEKLKNGVDGYKIKVRVIRLWRGSTKDGEEFKNFNIVLIDQKGQRIHAFVPTKCADDFQHQLHLGRVFSINHFAVQLYKQSDKYRMLRNPTQLVFTNDTEIQELADDGVTIPLDGFDFYDLSQLEELSKQTTYLSDYCFPTDVVGIIKDYDNIRDLRNKNGKDQKQAKYILTDGNSNINVTFWDKFAENFDKQMKTQLEQPVIIIISGCKVGKWNGQIDISNNNATRIYLNYKHHSVTKLRKLLTNPEFAKKVLGKPKPKQMAMSTVSNLTKLGKEDIEGLFMLHVKIIKLDESLKWFYNACTSCDKETKIENLCPVCENCNRFVPYPQKKFRIHVVAEDKSGQMQVVLGDREVRTVIGRRASDLADEIFNVQGIPKCLLAIVDKDYSLVIQIKEINIVKSFKFYWATNICRGFVNLPVKQTDAASTSQEQTSQATASNDTAQEISDVNLASSLQH
ncbi:hypothetical protein ACET3Z_028014 [Daucus carota]